MNGQHRNGRYVQPSRVYDRRGNAADRQRRREKLLADPRWGGDGVTTHCWACSTPISNADMQVDRREPGGSYRYGNCQPSCFTCNRAREDNAAWEPPRPWSGVVV